MHNISWHKDPCFKEELLNWEVLEKTIKQIFLFAILNYIWIDTFYHVSKEVRLDCVELEQVIKHGGRIFRK